MICLDANILIEVILGRKKATACRELIQRTTDDIAITILSLDLVMYYAEKNKLSLAPIEQFLRTFIWLAIVESDVDKAFKRYTDDDFEDALQISCALRESCTKFVTLDSALAKKYAKDISVTRL